MLFYQPHYYTDTQAEPGVQRKTRLRLRLSIIASGFAIDGGYVGHVGTLFGPAAHRAVQKRVPSRNVIYPSGASPHQNGLKPKTYYLKPITAHGWFGL